MWDWLRGIHFRSQGPGHAKAYWNHHRSNIPNFHWIRRRCDLIPRWLKIWPIFVLEINRAIDLSHIFHCNRNVMQWPAARGKPQKSWNSSLNWFGESPWTAPWSNSKRLLFVVRSSSVHGKSKRTSCDGCERNHEMLKNQMRRMRWKKRKEQNDFSFCSAINGSSLLSINWGKEREWFLWRRMYSKTCNHVIQCFTSNSQMFTFSLLFV